MTQPGLRERKKQETRRRITEAAIELFAKHGFERVPVTDIAAAVDLSPATVFNYFPTKEDLVYDGMASFHDALLTAIRERPAGSSVVGAFRDHVLQRRGLLADPDPAAVEGLARLGPVIDESPSLQARERLEADKATAALRGLLEAELGAGDLRAWAAASALIGIMRGMSRAVRAGAAQRRVTRRFADDLLAEAGAAIDVVERGLRPA